MKNWKGVGDLNRFAHIFDTERSRLPDWDQPIAENEHFAAIFSLGALVPGWVLIVPRRPVLNMALLNDEEKASLAIFCEHVVSLLSVYECEKIYAFEHGATLAGSIVGCGADHGHLHLVALDFDLIEAAKSTSLTKPNWQQFEAEFSPIDHIAPTSEYIFVRDWFEKSGIWGRVERPVSQWVRRVIASAIGKEEAWDYRKHPQRRMIKRAAKKMTTGI